MTDRLHKLLKTQESCRWLFYGDSITHGACHTFGKRDFSGHFREHIIWELKRQHDLVLNSAFSGYTLRDLLREFDARAAFFQPHAVFVMVGTNDCVKYPREEFRENLQKLLDKFRQIGCCMVLQTPPPLITPLDPRRGENLQAYPEIIREFAGEFSLDLIDHWRAWEKLPQQERYYLMSDPVHPNEIGHLKIAQDLFRYLECFSPEYPTCRMQWGPGIEGE